MRHDVITFHNESAPMRKRCLKLDLMRAFNREKRAHLLTVGAVINNRVGHMFRHAEEDR